MRGLADSLDPDSAYLTASEARSLDGARLRLGRADVRLRRHADRRRRHRADAPGTTCASSRRATIRRPTKAGLQTGDYVRAIDGKPARDLSVFEGMRLLRGDPGTKVTLTIIRGNAAEPHADRARCASARPARSSPRRCWRRISATSASRRSAPDAAGQGAERRPPRSRSNGAKRLIVDIRRTAEGPFDTGIETARALRQDGHAGADCGPRPAGEGHRQAAGPRSPRRPSRRRSPPRPATAPSICR